MWYFWFDRVFNYSQIWMALKWKKTDLCTCWIAITRITRCHYLFFNSFFLFFLSFSFIHSSGFSWCACCESSSTVICSFGCILDLAWEMCVHVPSVNRIAFTMNFTNAINMLTTKTDHSIFWYVNACARVSLFFSCWRWLKLQIILWLNAWPSNVVDWMWRSTSISITQFPMSLDGGSGSGCGCAA